MGLNCGIVGLPNVGKSTLFNALSNAGAQAANFPFCTIEPNLGVIQVPDDRLQVLADLVKPQKVIPNTVEVFDIAGLVKGAHKGEGLGNQFLSHIRATNAIIHVLRCFDDENIVHVDGHIDPLRDKEVIDTELQLKDLESVEKKIQKTEKIAKAAGDKAAKEVYETLKKVHAELSKGISVRMIDLNDKEQSHIQDLFLLTQKPVIYLCNVSEQDVVRGNDFVRAVEEMSAKEKALTLTVSAQIEAEIASLDDPEERALFLDEMGLESSGASKVIKAAYDILDLITFFTAGEKEVRAWSVKKGATAPQAAGEIHTDFEKGFIRAEVTKYQDYIHFGSEQACKEAGKLAVEGKNYVVQDGDIMHFRFNV